MRRIIEEDRGRLVIRDEVVHHRGVTFGVVFLQRRVVVDEHTVGAVRVKTAGRLHEAFPDEQQRGPRTASVDEIPRGGEQRERTGAELSVGEKFTVDGDVLAFVIAGVVVKMYDQFSLRLEVEQASAVVIHQLLIGVRGIVAVDVRGAEDRRIDAAVDEDLHGLDPHRVQQSRADDG